MTPAATLPARAPWPLGMPGVARAELALRELSHRAANDLATVAALLSLRRMGVAEGQARAALDDAAACVQALALVHREVEPRAGDTLVELAQYLPRLLGHLEGAYLRPMGVTAEAAILPARVPAATAGALGLITCELVRNAAKHAFADGRRGRVSVTLRTGAPAWELLVADDGLSGQARGGTRGGSVQGQGLGIVGALAASLNGTMEVARTRGTVVAVRFEPAPGVSRLASPLAHEEANAGRDEACRP